MFDTRGSILIFAEIFIAGYTLQFQAPSPNFQSDTILSDSNNRQNLQAALTSLIQKDALLAGSIVEVNQTWTRRRLRQRRRRASSLLPLTFDLYMTTGKSCVSPLCISQWQNSTVNILSSTNPRLPVARYDYQNTSISYRLEYQLPFTFHTSKTHRSALTAKVSPLHSRHLPCNYRSQNDRFDIGHASRSRSN